VLQAEPRVSPAPGHPFTGVPGKPRIWTKQSIFGSSNRPPVSGPFSCQIKTRLRMARSLRTPDLRFAPTFSRRAKSPL